MAAVDDVEPAGVEQGRREAHLEAVHTPPLVALRDVALAGDFAVRALRELMEVMPYDCRYVFRSVRKGGKFNVDDKPITGTDVYRMWRKSCVMAGVDSTKPHDARRTFITEGLTVGVETHNIQKQVGHARADTTLHYAQSLDAKNIRAKLRFRYGD